MMGFIGDTNEDQKTVLFKILGYTLDGLQQELDWGWRLTLYGDLVCFLEHAFTLEDMDSEMLGKLVEVKNFLASEHQQTLKGLN